MIKMITVIDCDQCEQPFKQVAVALKPDQNSQAIQTLTALALEDGWHVFHQQFRCADCLLEDFAARQSAF